MANPTYNDEQVSILYSNGACPVAREYLRVSFSSEYDRRQLPAEYEQAIDSIWSERCAANPSIWNGSKFRLHSVSVTENGRKQWNLGLTCYKDFLGTNFSPEADLLQTKGKQMYDNSQTFMSDPMGVGCLLLTKDNRIVIIKRSSSCAEAPLLYDIPGGHPEPEEISGGGDIAVFTADAICDEIFTSILREVRDEVNLPIKSLSPPLLLGIALNKCSRGRPSSEYLIKTDLCGDEVINLYNKGNQAEADESTHIKLIPHREVMEIRQSDMWEHLAPSAKGCFLLYHDYMQKLSTH